MTVMKGHMTIRKAMSTLSRFIFPPICLCCRGRLLSHEEYVCFNCITSWAVPSWVDINDNPLARRFWGIFPVESAYAAFFYVSKGRISSAVHIMKYGNNPRVGLFLGRLMAANPNIAAILNSATALLPVPITDDRRRQRHYNQSELLCQGMVASPRREGAKNLPILTDVVVRNSFNDSQTAMNRMERMENIRGVFSLKDEDALVNQHVVIVDDIITTGATVMELILTLRNIPGIRISVISLAMTRS